MYIHLFFTCLQMNEKKKFNTIFAMSSILLCSKVARVFFLHYSIKNNKKTCLFQFDRNDIEYYLRNYLSNCTQ